MGRRGRRPAPARPDLASFQPVPVPEAEAPSQPPSAVNRPPSDLEGSQTKPNLPAGVNEYFLPLNYSLTEAFKTAAEPMPVDARLEAVLYRPVLLAAAKVRFFDRRYGIDSEIVRDALVETLDRRGGLRWDDFPYDGPGMEKLELQPSPQARFAALDGPLSDAKLLAALQKDFVDWVFRTTQVSARANETLKIYAGPDVSPAEFRTACSDAARQARDAEVAKATTTLDRQMATLNDKLGREERELSQDEVEYENRKREETGNMLELGAGLLGLGRKKSLTTQFSKSRLSQQAKAEVDESIQAIKQFQLQLQELQQRRAQIIQEANERWAAVVNQVSEIPVSPKKTDVFVEVFGVAWQPFYLVRTRADLYELPAFGAE